MSYVDGLDTSYARPFLVSTHAELRVDMTYVILSQLHIYVEYNNVITMATR